MVLPLPHNFATCSECAPGIRFENISSSEIICKDEVFRRRDEKRSNVREFGVGQLGSPLHDNL